MKRDILKLVKMRWFYGKTYRITPTYGKEAAEFLNRMNEHLSEKDNEFKKRYDETGKVLF
jgi:hypothetical protein